MTRRPTFTVSEPLVRVHMMGVPRPPGIPDSMPELGPLPTIPDDQGLYGKMRDAMRDGELPRDFSMVAGGGGQYTGYFRVVDVARVIEWMSKHADLVSNHPKK